MLYAKDESGQFLMGNVYISSAMWDNVKSHVTVAKNYSRETLHQRISEDQFAVDSTQYSGSVFCF